MHFIYTALFGHSDTSHSHIKRMEHNKDKKHPKKIRTKITKLEKKKKASRTKSGLNWFLSAIWINSGWCRLRRVWVKSSTSSVCNYTYVKESVLKQLIVERTAVYFEFQNWHWYWKLIHCGISGLRLHTHTQQLGYSLKLRVEGLLWLVKQLIIGGVILEPSKTKTRLFHDNSPLLA